MKKQYIAVAILVLVTFFENRMCSDTLRDTQKPWTIWWWMGNAVDTANIKYNLKKFHESGLGGVNIVPIYGVKGEEAQGLKYLSKEWIQMLKFTSVEAKKLGLGVDMALGSGWCYGGANVSPDMGIMSLRVDKYTCRKGANIIDISSKKTYQIDKVECVIAELKNGERINVSDYVTTVNTLNWKSPEDDVKIYVAKMQGPRGGVKRAAQDAKGYMLNPFSSEAFENYNRHFEVAFNNQFRDYLGSIYHDSYEYFSASWSDKMFDKFREKRGYDLRNYIPELYAESDNETTREVLADYRLTLSEMHLDYVKIIHKWANSKGLKFRNQGHGSPANWLDIYSNCDIPETESFGSSKFQIPGLTYNKGEVWKDYPDFHTLKFSSSAANVSGKKLVSSETHTWLRDHFKVAFSHCKPELDKLFLAGINHVFYHGTAYTPKEAEWPGWLFYASTNFAHSNSQYPHFGALNRYVENCQKILQEYSSANEILLYYPFSDILHSGKSISKGVIKITMHNFRKWLYETPFHNSAKLLDSLGFAYDFISDNQIKNSKFKSGKIKTSGGDYKLIVVPECETMPISTLKHLYTLARKGAKVIFLNSMPQNYYGLDVSGEKKSRFHELSKNLKERVTKVDSDSLKLVINASGVMNEEFSSYKITYIKKKKGKKTVYFISNLYAGKSIDKYIRLTSECKDVVLYSPMSGRIGKADIKYEKGTKLVRIQLRPGESLFIITNEFCKKKWNYRNEKISSKKIDGKWELRFKSRSNNLPERIQLDKLKSWSDINNDTKYYSGVAEYNVDFRFNKQNSNRYILKFSKVKESAKMLLNGNTLPILFAYPYEIDITEYLRDGKNNLKIKVANLSANRIISLDKKGVNWKQFHDINFVNIRYKKFDASNWDPLESGIIGDVIIEGYYSE